MQTMRRSILRRLISLIAAPAAARAAETAPSSPGEEALLRQIAEKSKTDPLIGAKIGSKDLTQRLITAMKTERGVHIESLLCALGSLAGYACQAAVRAQAQARGLPDEKVFTKVETKDGKTYFFGDSLNKPLAEAKYSVWGVAAGGAQAAGCSSILDLADVFKHTSSSVGTPAFGVPRLPEAHKPQDGPINYVRALWPSVKRLTAKYCPDPELWPVMIALSIQEAIAMGKGVLDPCLALRIVMESAVPMSKINLAA